MFAVLLTSSKKRRDYLHNTSVQVKFILNFLLHVSGVTCLQMSNSGSSSASGLALTFYLYYVSWKLKIFLLPVEVACVQVGRTTFRSDG